MFKHLLVILLLYYSVKAEYEYEYEYEIIEDFIPKTIISDRADKIIKYNLSCKNERNKNNIYFQIIKNKDYHYLYFYDDFTKIQKDEKGNYINYLLRETIISNKPVITFNRLTCNKDYYFIIYNEDYDMDTSFSNIQISMVNDETKIFNLSPSLSLNYTLYPRENHKEEIFYYSFNENKYALINYNGSIKIEENNKIINNNTKLDLFEFKKDLKYFIYYKSKYPIYIQFYNDNILSQNNFAAFPMMLSDQVKINISEIDISNYKVGDYILLEVSNGCNIKYKYKNDSSQNYINLGKFDSFNYIPIQITRNDSSLVFFIEYSDNYFQPKLEIMKVELEVNFDFNSTIKGPKYIIFDYYKINGFKSFAIESNKNFSFREQELDKEIKMSYEKKNNIFICNQNFDIPQIYKRAFIYLDSTDEWNFVIKRFNFSFTEKTLGIFKGNDYIDLCKGEEPKTEFYYYKNNDKLEILTPVFGYFDSFYIDKSEIKTISDFDFSKAKEKDFIPKDHYGYLKIVCKEPVMVKHSYLNKADEISILLTGQRYIISTNSNNDEFKLLDNNIGKIVSLKFTLFGAENNCQIELVLNGSKYILGNESLEFELEYPYLDITDYLFKFNKGENIKEEMLIEIVVGIKEDIKNYKIQDLSESFGNLIINPGSNIIIKVQKEYNEDYNNFFIIQDYIGYNCYIDISYDKIEFMPINLNLNHEHYDSSQVVPLFNANPYSYIPNNINKSDEKFFYILIYNAESFNKYIYIKKPKLYTDLKLKKINSFPQLKGEEEKYYYKIPLPNEDYNSLSIQTYKNDNFLLSLSKDNIIYPFYLNEESLYNISLDKKDLLNEKYYLNYYGASFSDEYLNFVVGDGFIQSEIDKSFSPYLNILQKKKTNKLIIDIKSYSYLFKRPMIYYLIINEPNDDKTILSALSEKRIFGKNKMMLKLEDNGEDSNFHCEVDINKDLVDTGSSNDNNMTVVPVDKETNFVLINMKINKYFIYENLIPYYIWIIIIIVIIILVLAITIGLLYYRKKKKEKNNDIENDINISENILSEN